MNATVYDNKASQIIHEKIAMGSKTDDIRAVIGSTLNNYALSSKTLNHRVLNRKSFNNCTLNNESLNSCALNNRPVNHSELNDSTLHNRDLNKEVLNGGDFNGIDLHRSMISCRALESKNLVGNSLYDKALGAMRRLRMGWMAVVLLFLGVSYGCAGRGGESLTFAIEGNREIDLVADSTSLLRNPCMGWGLYDDADDEVANAERYWRAQDSIGATQYASFFYVRWRWSDMEPEEGHYAWQQDENYKRLVQGALDRGLKLAFRVYIHGQDNLRPGTPAFVREAGAKGCVVGGHWTPFIDDPVFREKLTRFVKAFAREYDNPSIVDFVDGLGAGWWGECHHLNLKDPTRVEETLEWFTDLYGRNFRRVPLVMPVCSQFGFDSEMRIAQGTNGYGFRRDGLGSHWFLPEEKECVKSLFPQVLLIGEQCYWKGDESDRIYFTDRQYHFEHWRQVLEATYRDAIEYHFNTLDLREPLEAGRWLRLAPDLVEAFVRQGGYRLLPRVISLPKKVRSGERLCIGHRWENLATGVLPNSNERWNFKYKVAFALIDERDNICQTFVDRQSDPGRFIQGTPVDYLFNLHVNGVHRGRYRWAVAIVDSSDNDTPAIRLAVKEKTIKGWIPLSEVIIE